jgi:hypothetical protein
VGSEAFRWFSGGLSRVDRWCGLGRRSLGTLPPFWIAGTGWNMELESEVELLLAGEELRISTATNAYAPKKIYRRDLYLQDSLYGHQCESDS